MDDFADSLARTAVENRRDDASRQPPKANNVPSVGVGRALDILGRCFWALFEWTAHTALAVAMLTVAELGRRAVYRDLAHQPVFFNGTLPVSWLFDAADIGLWLSLAVFGIVAATRAYRGAK